MFPNYLDHSIKQLLDIVLLGLYTEIDIGGFISKHFVFPEGHVPTAIGFEIYSFKICGHCFIFMSVGRPYWCYIFSASLLIVYPITEFSEPSIKCRLKLWWLFFSHPHHCLVKGFCWSQNGWKRTISVFVAQVLGHYSFVSIVRKRFLSDPWKVKA